MSDLDQPLAPLTRIIHRQCRPDQTDAINAGTAFANQSCDHQLSVQCGKSRLWSSGTGLREFAPDYVNNPGLTLDFRRSRRSNRSFSRWSIRPG